MTGPQIPTSPIIQLPYLRPDPLHVDEGAKEAGAGISWLANFMMRLQGQQQDSENQKKTLLTHLGTLKLAQDKFAAEQEQQKEKTKQAKQQQDALSQLGQHVTGLLQQADQPPDIQKAFQSMVVDMVQGGDRAGLNSLIGTIGKMREAGEADQKAQARQAQVAGIVGEAGDAFRTDPKTRIAALNKIRTIDPDLANSVNQQVPFAPVTFEKLTPGEKAVGVQAGKPTGTTLQGNPKEGAGGSGMLARVQFAASRALAGLDDATKIVRKDDEADVLPWAAQAGEAVGGKGSRELGASAKSQFMSTNQNLFDRAMTQVAHSISGLMGGGQRSIYIFQSMQSAYRPNAGQSDAETRQGFRQARGELRADLVKLQKGDLSVMSKWGFTPQDIQALGGEAPPQAAQPAPVLGGDASQADIWRGIGERYGKKP